MTERRWRQGVVFGKFRPPHKGHGLLLRTALARVDHLTVFVCADASDTVPAPLRAHWLHEMHPTAEIRVVETTPYDAHDSALWAHLTRRWLGFAPDVVFTSENYGDAFARFLGAKHVRVDQERQRVPISASRILADPAHHLDFLDPPARAYFVPRVVLVGADSTGKTTLARALASHFRTTWVPEYGRTFWDGLLTLPPSCRTPTTADFEHIARAQQGLENQLARQANRLLVCDTDAFCTGLWHQRYLGPDAPPIEALRDFPRARWQALYLLTGAEIPWADDGTRDRLAERESFHARFRQALEVGAHPYHLVQGRPDERLAHATRLVEAWLRGRSAVR